MQPRTLARHATALAVLFALLVATACGSDKTTGPATKDVAGSYDATVFTASALGTTHDMLAAGASIHLVLSEDGTCSGHLFVPASDFTGEEVDEDLAGTWTLDGTTVTLTQSADTFLRDVQLTVNGAQLTGSQTIQGVTVHVVLERD
ncbi:MAG TPA: hypothetical protein VFK39_07625 [Gemmatimonadaceae bacterium]|nr:hypothetical protein [Gemmatimonadaceae bacterium]